MLLSWTRKKSVISGARDEAAGDKYHTGALQPAEDAPDGEKVAIDSWRIAHNPA